MQTRSKKGIYKPKVPFTGYTDLTLPTTIPTSATHDMQIPIWKKAMQEEFDALIRNKTWDLVPATPTMNVVGSKWIFKINTIQMVPYKDTRHAWWLKALLKPLVWII